MKLKYNIDFVEDKYIKSNLKKAISVLEKSFYTHKEVSSFFLNPFEIKIIKDIARLNSIDIVFLSPNIKSERKIFIANPYSSNLNSKDYFSVLEFTHKDIRHPDVLGSLMNLGLERNDIGDIFIEYGICEFVILNKEKNFVKFNLSKIKDESINLKFKEDNTMQNLDIEYNEFMGFVSSLRLDNIISELINLSRAKAKNIISRRLVKIDYQTIDNPSKEVQEGSLISIRSYGRFIFDEIKGLSKKGNYRIKYRKYKWFTQ